jgi:hypothetical protein
VFRALNHEGVAADCFYELFVGDQKLPKERRMRAYAACAVLAGTLTELRKK